MCNKLLLNLKWGLKRWWSFTTQQCVSESRDHQLISAVNLISWGSLNGDRPAYMTVSGVGPSGGSPSHALRVDLSVCVCTSSYYAAWLPSKTVPIQQVEVHAFLWAGLSNHRASSYFSLPVKAATKVYLGFRGEAFISPLDEKQCQSLSERRASWATCACVAILKTPWALSLQIHSVAAILPLLKVGDLQRLYKMVLLLSVFSLASSHQQFWERERWWVL